MGGSEAAAVLWEFGAAAPEVLCWACEETHVMVSERYAKNLALHSALA